MKNDDIDESIWQKLSAAFFGARKTSDERLFTSRVMAQIRNRQPEELPWRIFTRWAIPALALSMGSFTIAAVYSLQPDPVSAEALLLGDQDPGLSEEWLAAAPAEEIKPQLEAIR